jgi:leucyl aminopeptidase (aminopeptidase T)
MNRKDFLKKSITTFLVIGAGSALFFACAKIVPQRKEPPPPLSPAEQRDKAIDNLYKINLAVKRSERVLVFTDDQNPVITKEARYVAKRGAAFGEIIFFKYPNTGLPGVEPPKTLWERAFGKNIIDQIEEKNLMEKMLQKKITEEELETVRKIIRENKKDVVNVVIGLAWHSTTHTNFRKLLTGSAAVRYASMPAFNPKMWQTAMSANWEEVAQRTLSLKNKLSGAISVHVQTPNGTKISFDIRGRGFSTDTGLLNQPGRSGNLPAGELAIAPVEGSSNGKMVIESGINPGVKGQMIFEIKDGKVNKMYGGIGFISWLESIFYKYPLARNIAEFGIGTNEKARAGTTILELEKILGTIHIGIGDNSTIGGKTLVPFHIDFIFENPTVDIAFSDGRILQIMKDGKLFW